MPTYNRRRYVEQALACFLAQDWPERELIVVDDGEPVRDLIPPSPMFTYVHLGEQKRDIGTKRNKACEMARGSIILHWDDDDWSAPGRITEQVRVLRQTGRPATGYNILPFAWDEGRLAWLYRGTQGYACGTSLAYLRAYWIGHRFPTCRIDANWGEDNEFIRKLSDRFISVSGRSIVARLHDQATCPKLDMLCGAHVPDVWKEIDYAQLAAVGYPIREKIAFKSKNHSLGSSEDPRISDVPLDSQDGSGPDPVDAPGDIRTSGRAARRRNGSVHGGRKRRNPGV